MPIFRDEFDPLGVAIDWLDAAKLGDLDGLLGLHDERATLECDCEGVVLTGRQSLSAYWGPKLESKLAAAFTLDDMTPTGVGGFNSTIRVTTAAPFAFASVSRRQGKSRTQAAVSVRWFLRRDRPPFTHQITSRTILKNSCDTSRHEIAIAASVQPGRALRAARPTRAFAAVAIQPLALRA